MEKQLYKILGRLPDKLVKIIVVEFKKLEARFSRGDWGPSELNGARYAEAIYRYLEWKDSGSYTPIGTQIIRHQIESKVSQNTSLPDGLRFQVLKSMDVLFDIRNKRDVAHLGENIDVNEMDSRLVMRMASWSLAEIIRTESGLSPQNIQSFIDELSAKSFPLIEEIDGDLVILATNLRTKEKTLVALYHTYSDPISSEELFQIVKYSDKSMYRSSVLANLEDDGLIHIKSEQIYLTQKGIAWIERNIEMELKIN